MAAERAESLRGSGKYQDARAALISCSRDVCPRGVSQLCADRLRALDAATPTVVPRAKDEKGNDLHGVRVTIDGAQVATPRGREAFPADPGEHLFRFEIAGAPSVDKLVVVRSGEKERVIAVVMHTVQPAPTPAVPHLDSATLTIASGDAPSEPIDPGRAAASITLVALAMASGVIGEYFILQSNDQASKAASLRSPLTPTSCANVASATCSSLGSAVDAEHSDLLIGRALVGGAVALALGAAATWFFWPAPRDRNAKAVWLAPAPAARGGALYLGGAF